MSRRPFDERVQTLTGNQLMFCGTRIDIKGSTVVEGELDLTRGDLKVVGTTEFEEISADNLTTTGNVTTPGNVQAEDVIATRDASVGQDLTVDGNNSVGGDLTVVGNASVGQDLTVVGNASVAGDLTVGNYPIFKKCYVYSSGGSGHNYLQWGNIQDIFGYALVERDSNDNELRFFETGTYLVKVNFTMQTNPTTNPLQYQPLISSTNYVWYGHNGTRSFSASAQYASKSLWGHNFTNKVVINDLSTQAFRTFLVVMGGGVLTTDWQHINLEIIKVA